MFYFNILALGDGLPRQVRRLKANNGAKRRGCIGNMIKGTSERDEVRGIPREFVIIHSHVIFIRSLRYESIPRLNSPG